MIAPESFAEKLAKSENYVAENIQAYLKQPNEDSVHDLRTSIRRLLATSSILPKNIRTKKGSKRYLEDHARLLRINARVRDLDIILSKMGKRREDPAYAKLGKKLAEDRQSSLKKAQKLARAIQEDTVLTIKPDDVSTSSLKKRFKKTAAKLAEKINKRLPIVTKEPENKAELHQLREDSRRLRYVLELDKSKETSEPLKILESWQDVLGAIHDSDIFIEHFDKGKVSTEIKTLIEPEVSARNENYQKFLAIAKESPSFK
jgi:CHAD domain-containing protein